MTLYVVATSQKEAQEISRDLPEVCHTTMESAVEHLADVKRPPTDPFYAGQYKVYTVER